jgi:hypothetical protein
VPSGRAIRYRNVGNVVEHTDVNCLLVLAEAATTWRSPADAKPIVRGSERLRA